MFKLKTTLGTNNICGPNLIRIRHEKGLSQRQLAKNLQIAGYDVDHHFIRRIENGERFVTIWNWWHWQKCCRWRSRT